MPLSINSEALIDRVYEAALVPSLWPPLLRELSSIVDSERALMFTIRDGYQSSIISPGWDDVFETFLRDWAYRDPILPAAIALSYPGFVTDSDLLSEDTIANHEVYRGYHRHFDMGYRAGTMIQIPNGDSLALSFPRSNRLGPVDRATVNMLDQFRPHIARAALTANRLGFERARAQAEAMQALGLPGAVLRGNRRIMAANALFEALIPSTVQDRQRRVMLTDEAADRLLAVALDAIAASQTRAVCSVPIAALAEQLPMILHVIPVRGAANDFFYQANALLVVTPVNRAAVPTAEVLQGLFDLTPAEARIARGIGQARSVDTMAKEAGVNRETVRSQLKAVLSKTGLSRQQELVSLLAGKAIRAEKER